ncbi:MAG: IPT/TIG domain-containing protein [Planctomycetota bacterium]
MNRSLGLLATTAVFVSLAGCGSSGSSGGSASTAASATSGGAASATSLVPAQGSSAQATSITVRGQGLVGVLGGRLIPDAGGTAAPIGSWQVLDAQTAQGVVPAGLPAGDYRLELVLASGAAATPATFEVLGGGPAASALSLTSISPTNGPNDRDHVVTLLGTGFTAGAQVRVGATVARSVVLKSSGELEAVFPAGVAAGSQPVVVTVGASSATGPAWSALNLIDPDQPGAYAASYREARIAGASGDTPWARYYYPATQAGPAAPPAAGAGPFPVVIYDHGFRPPIVSFGVGFRDNGFIAERLASFGYVVVCVDMASNNALFGTGQENSQRDADDTIAALDYLEQSNLDPAHPLYGLVDASRAAFVGHSRGGDAALMAGAAELRARGASARVLALAALAPPAFDSQASGAPLVFGDFKALPLLLVSGSEDPIAPYADQQAIFAQAGSPAMLVEIDGGNHSQFKDTDTRILGDAAPGTPLADQQDVVRRYLTAWLGAHVKGQQALFADYLLQGPRALADARLSRLEVR